MSVIMVTVDAGIIADWEIMDGIILRMEKFVTVATKMEMKNVVFALDWEIAIISIVIIVTAKKLIPTIF